MQYKNRPYEGDMSSGKRWLRFVSGLFILAGLIIFFGSGYAPPGVCGEVLRHNQKYNIDASPIFYGDVENMSEYETGIRRMIEVAKSELK